MYYFSKRLRLWLKRIFALLLIIAGAITFPLPIPIGAILMALGLALMLSTSKTLSRWVRNRRMLQPGLNQKLAWLETRLPRFFARALRKTAPDYGRRGKPGR